MSQKNLPIKIFEKRKKIDERKTEGSGDNKLPVWAQLSQDVLEKRVSDFTAVLDETAEKLKSRKRTRDFIPAVVKVEMHEQATAKSHRGDIASIFNANYELNLIGVTDERSLLVKINSEEDIRSINKKLSQISKNTKAIAAMTELSQFEPEINVKKVKQNDPLRVSLINFHNYQLNLSVSKAFENLCRSKEIKFHKANYSPELIIYRLTDITADALSEIKEFEALETLSFMPKYSITLDELVPNPTTKINIKEPQKDVDYPTVGILDSGIKNIPHLKPWILDKKFSKIPDDRIDPQHGTFVSGIVLYGDELENANYIGHDGCYLFDATVFPDLSKDSIEEFELVEHIREAIEKNKEVKIWNLSLGTNQEAEQNEFSYFGKALDQIQEANGVIICKSAGNCRNFIDGKPVSRIAKSADSVRSVVIGSIAHDKSVHDMAEINHPSPFSRIGKAPGNINKPELTHVGGNAGVHPTTGNLVTTGVKSFASSGQIASNVGTSFSTPRITSLLAGLDNRLKEGFNPLLLKALTIHSAKYPSVLNIPQTEKIKSLGFGVPSNVDDILYNNPNEITLILQDTLIKGNWIEIADFPFPQEMVNDDGQYYGEIIVTAVSSPILSESQGAEYCQSNLEVRLGTYDKLKTRAGRTIRNEIGLDGNENLLRDGLYASNFRKNHVGEFARERNLIKYGDKYQPIKKYAVNLEEMTATNKVNHLTAPKKWYLHVEGFYRDFIVGQAERDGVELSQDFCVIITIRDNKNKHNVYDHSTRLLNKNGFVHSDINIRNRVTVKV